MKEGNALSARIHEELEEISKVVARTLLLSAKAQNSGDDGYWDGVALNLHSYYTAIERIFEDIARTVDENIPTGSDWHRSLLLQMSAEVDKKRPAIIRRETRYCLEEYRGFRHVVRNVYAFNFRSSRLMELVSGLPGCFEMVKSDLLGLIKFLESI